jgi:phospholipase C
VQPTLKQTFLFRVSILLLTATVGCGGVHSDSSPTQPPGSKGQNIQNIIVIIMQNRSFDHLFGTFPGANGIRPGVPGYVQTDSKGATVTPQLLLNTSTADLPHSRNDLVRVWNSGAMDKYAFFNGEVSLGYYDESTPGMSTLWNWAAQFALADNFFPSVMSDAPTNQLYLVAANDNNNPHTIHPFFPPCNTGQKASTGYTFQHVGDQLAANGFTWGWYHENLGQCGSYVPQQNPFQYFIDAHDSPNLRDLSQFTSDLNSGNLPAVSFVQPGPAHSMHPAPGVPIASGINWLDGFIRQIQASKVWSKAAIIVIWDTSGGWWDHVPPPQVDAQGHGARVPMLAISPFSKTNHISHAQMDTVSILKFIQTQFGLPPLNSRNQMSNDLSDMFNF